MKMYRRKVLSCAVILCILGLTWAESPCVINGVSLSEGSYTNPEPINDSYIGVIQSFNDTNILDGYVEDPEYINVSVYDYVLNVVTMLDFEYYEEEKESSTISININLICEGGNDTLEYILNIQDVNNHDPRFEEEHYLYTFYDSFPGSVDVALTDLQPIIATDMDLSNDRVYFEMEENDFFTVNYTSESYTSKKYLAKLNTKKEITSPFLETFELTVTDSGNPSRRSTTQVTVQVNNTLPHIFTKSFYVAHFTENFEIIVDNGPISFVGNIENVTVTLPLKYSDYFGTKINPDGEVELTVTETDVSDLFNDKDQIVLRLHANSTLDVIQVVPVLITTEGLISEQSTEENDSTEVSQTDSGNATAEYSSEEVTTDFFTSEETTNYEQPTLPPRPVYVELSGFKYWVSLSTTFNIFIFVLAGVSIAGAIIYLKLKLCRIYTTD